MRRTGESAALPQMNAGANRTTASLPDKSRAQGETFTHIQPID